MRQIQNVQGCDRHNKSPAGTVFFIILTSGQICHRFLIESIEVDKLAIEYLSKAKIMLASDSLTIGFSEYELKNALLGNPFSLYTFNEKGQFVPSNTKVYPI